MKSISPRYQNALRVSLQILLGGAAFAFAAFYGGQARLRALRFETVKVESLFSPQGEPWGIVARVRVSNSVSNRVFNMLGGPKGLNALFEGQDFLVLSSTKMDQNELRLEFTPREEMINQACKPGIGSGKVSSSENGAALSFSTWLVISFFSRTTRLPVQVGLSRSLVERALMKNPTCVGGP